MRMLLALLNILLSDSTGGAAHFGLLETGLFLPTGAYC